MTATFRFDEVTKTYGSQIALDRFSLTGHEGEVVALLGENGAGKTTAIKILLGLISPDRGRSSVLNMNSKLHGQEIRRRVGYVPDQPALYDWMTVMEIGWFTSGLYAPGFFDAYSSLVKQYQLPEDRPIKQLSKGMRAKVSLALSLAHEPEVLVLDEPTSGLDAVVRREFLESMVDVAATGRTVFLCSHQIAEVERVADTVAVLRGGHLVLSEELAKLKSETWMLTAATTVEVPVRWPIDLKILSARHEGHHREWLVRGDRKHIDLFREQNPHFTSLQTDSPNLEEIFVRVMQPKPQNGQTRSDDWADPATWERKTEEATS
ncbi:ABC transporter ATP-binding protein [Thalassoroseus pseudoceratinae]|uniref:ABC transporter ATP-binding protein n=1 Tax=Thalassoroseus pseudoceratinae TaxID=2713176 RepID=UPI00142215BB|nr:ABC transporter ATP-binding protein [Thalassoroseus pseudoceratinae]